MEKEKLFKNGQKQALWQAIVDERLMDAAEKSTQPLTNQQIDSVYEQLIHEANLAYANHLYQRAERKHQRKLNPNDVEEIKEISQASINTNLNEIQQLWPDDEAKIKVTIDSNVGYLMVANYDISESELDKIVKQVQLEHDQSLSKTAKSDKKQSKDKSDKSNHKQSKDKNKQSSDKDDSDTKE